MSAQTIPPHAPSHTRGRAVRTTFAAAAVVAAVLVLVAAPSALTSSPIAPAVPLAQGEDGIQQWPGSYTVAATDDAFVPRVITVPVGAIVRWVNTGTHVHSSTSDQGYWNWTMVPGSSFGVRFLSAGSYDYHCEYHIDEQMRGTVVVVPAADFTPPPTPDATAQPTPGIPPYPTLPPFPPLPTAAPGPGTIVFDYFADEAARTRTDLFVVEPDGTGRRPLTQTTDVSEAQPNWSPDHREVVYTASPGEGAAGPWGLWLLDVASGQSHQLTAGPDDYEPEWRQDGAWIVFTRIRRTSGFATRSEIAVVSPTGGGERTLLSLDSTSHGLLNPTWSPDGRQLVFTVSSDFAGSELYLMNEDGSGIRRLFNHPGWHDIDPSWSPDGNYIAFASGSTARHDIWLADLRRGVAGTIVRQSAWDLRRPAWSPGSSWIVFNAQFQLAPPRWALYMVPATGGSVTGPVTLGVEPDWGGVIDLPTPPVQPTATTTPLVPPTPPVFPTLPRPLPTLEGPTPTLPPPPTFELPTPDPGEPTATTIPGEPTPTAGPIDAVGMIYLPVGVKSAVLVP